MSIVKSSQCDLTEKRLAGDVLNHLNVRIRMGTEKRINLVFSINTSNIWTQRRKVLQEKECKNQKQQSKSHQCLRFKTFNFNLSLRSSSASSSIALEAARVWRWASGEKISQKLIQFERSWLILLQSATIWQMDTDVVVLSQRFSFHIFLETLTQYYNIQRFGRNSFNLLEIFALKHIKQTM